MKVVFYEAFQEEAASLQHHLGESPDHRFDGATIQESSDAEAALPPAPIISIRTQSVIPPAWAPHLDAVITRSTGYDHLIDYAAETGTSAALGYLPRYCVTAVAEQALLLWMALIRKLPRQQDQWRTFNRDGLTGGECQGRTLAVVGVGNIGHAITKLGTGIGMRVLGVDLDPCHDDVEYVDIDVALGEAHIVVASMNLNDSNHGYFDRDRFARMRPGTLFVNIARGELSPPTAVLHALESGRLGGAALDVFDHEGILAASLRQHQFDDDAHQNDEIRATLALANRPDTILTPHNAFNTAESVDRKSADTARQLQHFEENSQMLWDVPAG